MVCKHAIEELNDSRVRFLCTIMNILGHLIKMIISGLIRTMTRSRRESQWELWLRLSIPRSPRCSKLKIFEAKVSFINIYISVFI